MPDYTERISDLDQVHRLWPDRYRTHHARFWLRSSAGPSYSISETDRPGTIIETVACCTKGESSCRRWLKSNIMTPGSNALRQLWSLRRRGSSRPDGIRF